MQHFLKKGYYLPLIFLILGIWWATHLPVAQAPDEYMRLAIPYFIVQNGCLPNGYDPIIRDSMWGISYAFTVYGSSLIVSPFMALVSLFTTDLRAMYITARIVNVFIGAATIVVVLKIGFAIFSRPLTPHLFGLMCGFMPQFLFVASYFNCDMFSAFASALIIYSWIFGLKHRWNKKSALLLGASIGICLLSYYFAYGLIVVSLFLYFISQASFLKQKGRLEARRLRWKTAGIIFLVAFAIGGWFFIRNAIIYGGDFTGMASYSSSASAFATDALKPEYHITPATRGWNIWQLLFENFRKNNWSLLSFQSSIGVFGYLKIFMADWMYVAYAIILAFGAILSPLFLKRYLAVPRKRLFALCLAAAILFPMLFSLYHSYFIDYQPQGRYLISASIPLLLIVCAGYEGLDQAITDWRAKTHSIIGHGTLTATPLATVAFSALFIIALVTTIIPSCTNNDIMSRYKSDTPITAIR